MDIQQDCNSISKLRKNSLDSLKKRVFYVCMYGTYTFKTIFYISEGVVYQ